MARPPKYTPERHKKVIDAIRLGATQRLAAAYAGVDEATVINWKHRYLHFLHAVNEAQGAATVGWLAKIEKAANDGTWQAAAWKLERLYPQEYGRRVIEATGPDGGPISFSLNIGDAVPQDPIEQPSLNGHSTNGHVEIYEAETGPLPDGGTLLP